MYRLTVIYSLKPEVDKQEFLDWRLGEHQASNVRIPDVIHTTFSQLDESWTQDGAAHYEFVTTIDWPDEHSFRQAFYDPDVQADLNTNLEKLQHYLFVSGAELLSEST